MKKKKNIHPECPEIDQVNKIFHFQVIISSDFSLFFLTQFILWPQKSWHTVDTTTFKVHFCVYFLSFSFLSIKPLLTVNLTLFHVQEQLKHSQNISIQLAQKESQSHRFGMTWMLTTAISSLPPQCAFLRLLCCSHTQYSEAVSKSLSLIKSLGIGWVCVDFVCSVDRGKPRTSQALNHLGVPYVSPSLFLSFLLSRCLNGIGFYIRSSGRAI